MDNENYRMGIRVLTVLLDSWALSLVISCIFVFVFGRTEPFAYIQSVTLRSERMKGYSNGLADLARPAGQVWCGLFALGLCLAS
jgi:hypothetical protein